MKVKQDLIIICFAISAAFNGFFIFKLKELKMQAFSQEALITSLSEKVSSFLITQNLDKIVSVNAPVVTVQQNSLSAILPTIAPWFLGLLGCVIIYSITVNSINSAQPFADAAIIKLAKIFGVYKNDHLFIMYGPDRCSKLGELSFSSNTKFDGLTNIQYVPVTGDIATFASEEALHQCFIAEAASAALHQGAVGEITLTLARFVL